MNQEATFPAGDRLLAEFSVDIVLLLLFRALLMLFPQSPPGRRPTINTFR